MPDQNTNLSDNHNLRSSVVQSIHLQWSHSKTLERPRQHIYTIQPPLRWYQCYNDKLITTDSLDILLA